MPTAYNVQDVLSPSYADKTVTRAVKMDADTLYKKRILSIHGAVMVDDILSAPSYVVADFIDRESVAIEECQCIRLGGAIASLGGGGVSVVVALSYDELLIDRIEKLVSSLASSDANSAFQYLSLISSMTKNVIAENNTNRDRKSKREGQLKACQL